MIYSTKETMPEDGQRVALVHKDSLISAIFKSGSFYTLYERAAKKSKHSC